MRYLIWAAALLLPTGLWAQTSLALRLQSNQTASVAWQPAFLLNQDFERFQLGLDADYFLAANTLAYADANLEGFIDEEQKTRILNALGNDNRLRGGLSLGGMLNFRLGNLPLSLSYRQRQSLAFRVNEPNTVGLILRGNAPYAGTTIEEENLSFQNLSYRQIGIGTAYAVGKLTIGTRVNLLMGQSIRHLQQLDYTFLTDLDGTAISTQADYEWFAAAADDNFHAGFSADIGLVYEINEKWEANFSALDLGTIYWGGTLYRNQIDFQYSGIEIADIFDFQGSSFNNALTTDSLQTLFFPDSAKGNYQLNLAPTLQAGVRFQPDSLQLIWANVQFGATPFAEANYRPLVGLGYQRVVLKNLRMGTQFALGGLEGFGWGINVGWTIPFREKQSLDLFYSFENTLGVLAPSIGRGVRMNGGISLRL